MNIADKLTECYSRLLAKDRIRIQALAGLGPAAALTAILIIIGERYGYRIGLAVGFIAIIIVAYMMIYLRSRIGERRFFLIGLASLIICWLVSLALFAKLLKDI